jgi:hypothetical protein
MLFSPTYGSSFLQSSAMSSEGAIHLCPAMLQHCRAFLLMVIKNLYVLACPCRVGLSKKSKMNGSQYPKVCWQPPQQPLHTEAY